MSLYNKFQTAVKVVQSLPKEAANPDVKAALPGNEELLECYALYKHVEKGPCTESEKPSFWQVVDTYKYNARMELRDISKDDAMEKYIAVILRIINRMPASADKDKQLNLINPPPPQPPKAKTKPQPQPVVNEKKMAAPSAPAAPAPAPTSAPISEATPNVPPLSAAAAAVTSDATARKETAPLQMLVNAAEAAQRAPVTAGVATTVAAGTGAAASRAAAGAGAAAAAAVTTTPTKTRETHGLMYAKPGSSAATGGGAAATVTSLPASTSTPLKPQSNPSNAVRASAGVAYGAGAGASAGASAVQLAARELTSDTDNFHDSVEEPRQLDTSGIESGEATAFQLALDKLQRDLNVTTNRVREVEFLLRDQRSGSARTGGGGRMGGGGGGGGGAGVLNSVFGQNADVVRTGLWLAWPLAVAWWMKPKQTPLRRNY